MRDDFTVFAGTVGMGGAGIWRSPDGGKTWSMPRGSKDEMNCCALAVHPSRPSVIYAGLRNGIYRSDDHGKHFYRLESPVNAYEVWSVVVDAADPDIVFAGCRPGAIFRTRDGGERWEKCPAEFTDEGVFGGPARVLRMVQDPDDHNIVWAGTEADGIRLSTDGGESWRDVSAGLTDPDIHGLAISTGNPNKLFASADLEVFTTEDLGESWQPLGVQERFEPPNCRTWRSRATIQTRFISPLAATTTRWPGSPVARVTVAKPGTRSSFPSHPTHRSGTLRCTRPIRSSSFAQATTDRCSSATMPVTAGARWPRNSARSGRSPGHRINQSKSRWRYSSKTV